MSSSRPGGWAEGWIGSDGANSAKRSRNSRVPRWCSAPSAGRYSLPASGSSRTPRPRRRSAAQRRQREAGGQAEPRDPDAEERRRAGAAGERDRERGAAGKQGQPGKAGAPSIAGSQLRKNGGACVPSPTPAASAISPKATVTAATALSASAVRVPGARSDAAIPGTKPQRGTRFRPRKVASGNVDGVHQGPSIDVILPVLDEAEALPGVLAAMPAGYRAARRRQRLDATAPARSRPGSAPGSSASRCRASARPASPA